MTEVAILGYGRFGRALGQLLADEVSSLLPSHPAIPG